ncbi:MAG: hypothetical protein EBS47_12780 [Betaproteobacteria bacterium]|nr:hypothetical protein [Betaproteobacteria bacterium]
MGCKTRIHIKALAFILFNPGKRLIDQCDRFINRLIKRMPSGIDRFDCMGFKKRCDVKPHLDDHIDQRSLKPYIERLGLKG